MKLSELILDTVKNDDAVWNAEHLSAAITARLHECVKPLEWSDLDEKSNYSSCDALGKHSYWYKSEAYGAYVKVYLSSDFCQHKNCIGTYDTLKAAKAAAQAHYAAQIIGGLDL